MSVNGPVAPSAVYGSPPPTKDIGEGRRGEDSAVAVRRKQPQERSLVKPASRERGNLLEINDRVKRQVEIGEKYTRKGTVVNRYSTVPSSTSPNIYLYSVKWDDGITGHGYMETGLVRDASNG